MNKVDIAMATFNGEKFIREQIASIERQTYSNWQLFISDDGSTDNTVKIIKELANKNERITLVNTERQGGVVKNFNKALSATEAEYVVLSDQDDIWPEERLARLVETIEKYKNQDSNKSLLVFTDLEVIDKNGNIKESSFYQANNIEPYENMRGNNLLWRSSVYGCTTIVNRKLLDRALPIPQNALMHDQWLALHASQENGLYYFDYCSIKYRQHDNNVTGGSKKNLLEKLKSFPKSYKVINKDISKTKKNMLEYNYLYKNGRGKISNRKDLIIFALKEVFPHIFKGSKKMYSLFAFLSFVLAK